jgi:hypothetical protein
MNPDLKSNQKKFNNSKSNHMLTKNFSSKKKLITLIALLLFCSSSFSQKKFCECFQFLDLEINRNFNMISAWPFRVASDNQGTGNFIDGGRFFIAAQGNTGIGNPNPTNQNGTIWPTPLAKLHVNGTNILGGNSAITGDTALQRRWVNLGLNSNASWGLWVDKGVVATDYAITTAANWADFVFDDNYKLRPLAEVERFIKLNKHLPEIPSAQTIRDKGYTLQDMNTRFMQKIEELTLYTIEQDKQINLLKKQLEELAAQMKLLADRPASK